MGLSITFPLLHPCPGGKASELFSCDDTTDILSQYYYRHWASSSFTSILYLTKSLALLYIILAALYILYIVDIKYDTCVCVCISSCSHVNVYRCRLQKMISRHNLVIASYDVVRNDIYFFSYVYRFFWFCLSLDTFCYLFYLLIIYSWLTVCLRTPYLTTRYCSI